MSGNELTTIERRRCRPFSAGRAQRGDFLIEAVVAALIAGVLTLGLVRMFVLIRQEGNMSQGLLLASSMSNEVIDGLRSLSFQTLSANLGEHHPEVNGAGLGNQDQLFPRPLLTDTSLDYTNEGDPTVSKAANNVGLVTCDPLNNNPNSIAVTLTQPNANSVNVEVQVKFLDGTGKWKNYTLRSIITNDGLNG